MMTKQIPDILWLANIAGSSALCKKNPMDPTFEPQDYDVLDDSVYPVEGLIEEDKPVKFIREDETKI